MSTRDVLRTVGSCSEGPETSSDAATVGLGSGVGHHVVPETLQSSVTSGTTRDGTWMGCFRYVSPHVVDERKEVLKWIAATTTSLPTTDVRWVFRGMGGTSVVIEFK